MTDQTKELLEDIHKAVVKDFADRTRLGEYNSDARTITATLSYVRALTTAQLDIVARLAKIESELSGLAKAAPNGANVIPMPTEKPKTRRGRPPKAN